MRVWLNKLKVVIICTQSAGIGGTFLTRKRASGRAGPRTAEGLTRSQRARWKQGLYSADARAEQSVSVSYGPKVESS
jgi:hypothetical protein